MDDLIIGLRAQDFHESLRVTGAFGPKDVKFKNTLLIGKAASLAMHLRGLLYVEDVAQLEWAAASLGISSLELPAILRELEAVDFLHLVKHGDTLKRVDVKVPEFRSGYAELGQRWKDLNPSEVEQAGVATLDSLYGGPIAVDQLQQSLGLPRPEFSILRDVMRSGLLLDVQIVEGESTAYTPLAVDGNPDAYLQWARRFPSEVHQVVQVLSQRQGLPLTDPQVASNAALNDAIHTGVLMPVTVNGATGSRKFLFAPRGGLSPADRTILDKARAILSCVRYGQHFAQGRRITRPRRILEVLRDDKKFSRGHPDLFSQYGLLVEKLIGHPVDEGNGPMEFPGR